MIVLGLLTVLLIGAFWFVAWWLQGKVIALEFENRRRFRKLFEDSKSKPFDTPLATLDVMEHNNGKV